MCVRYQADEKPPFSLTCTHALFCVPRMHPGPNAGEGKGCCFGFSCSIFLNQLSKERAWPRHTLLPLVVCLFVLIRTTLVLTFHGGGPYGDPPLRILSALPSVPGAWRIGGGGRSVQRCFYAFGQPSLGPTSLLSFLFPLRAHPSLFPV